MLLRIIFFKSQPEIYLLADVDTPYSMNSQTDFYGVRTNKFSIFIYLLYNITVYAILEFTSPNYKIKQRYQITISFSIAGIEK